MKKAEIPERVLLPWKKYEFRTPPAAIRQRLAATAFALRHRYLVGRGREEAGYGSEGREALPHTPLRELFEKSSLKIFKNFEQVEWSHSHEESRNSGKSIVAMEKVRIPDASGGTSPAGCRFHFRAPAPDLSGSRMRGCGYGSEGREALPHTPFKELFEKSSLKIFKNFGQVEWSHSHEESRNSGKSIVALEKVRIPDASGGTLRAACRYRGGLPPLRIRHRYFVGRRRGDARKM